MSLAPDELHSLWRTLGEDRRLAFIDSLTQEAADQLFAFQIREHEQRLRSEAEQRKALEPPELAPAERRQRNRIAVANYRQRRRAQQSASTD